MFKSHEPKDVVMELMELKPTEIPKIYIGYKALLKMSQIVNQCSAEVGWLGSVEVVDNNYIITDVYLLKQKVTGVTTELDEEALSDLLYYLVQNEPETYNTIKLWGHSHVNMACIPSTQDDETFKEYYNDNPFFIRLIANKKEEMRIDIAIKETGMIFKKLPWEVIYPDNIIEAMEEYAEISEKLSEAEKKVISFKEMIENEFKERLNKEIKEKVTEDRKYYGKKKEEKKEEKKTIPYYWRDEEMDDYASWYDYYGYTDNGTYNALEEMMSKCDAGKKILCREEKEALTEVMDPYEIIEIAEGCNNWRDVETYLAGDNRFYKYKKKDWIELYDSVRATYKEYERRIA